MFTYFSLSKSASLFLSSFKSLSICTAFFLDFFPFFSLYSLKKIYSVSFCNYNYFFIALSLLLLILFCSFSNFFEFSFSEFSFFLITASSCNLSFESSSSYFILCYSRLVSADGNFRFCLLASIEYSLPVAATVFPSITSSTERCKFSFPYKSIFLQFYVWFLSWSKNIRRNFIG